MDPSIDEFAQTRPPDDLFDDDFTPVVESQLVYDPPPPAPAPQPQQQFREPRYDGPRDLPRGVPRGPRGARGGRRGGAAAAPRSPPKPAPPISTTDDAEPAPATEGASSEDLKPDDEPTSPTAAPTGPATATKTTPSVRGDRSLTGGPAKKKLTDTELAAKLAAMSLKNKALTEAHEKAQKDQEAYTEREQRAAERRKVEKAERQVMMGERERNRERKLKAFGGREWDAEKNEEDFRDDGRRARRGAHGGVTGSRYGAPEQGDGAVPEGHESSHHGGYSTFRGDRGRGRGGRGGGRGRGDHSSTPQRHQAPPKAEDFPDLPATAPPTKSDAPSVPKDLEFPNKKKATPDASTPDKLNTTSDGKKEAERPKLDKQTSFGFTPTTEKRSWADQMDATSP
jgi:hypothetical protein